MKEYFAEGSEVMDLKQASDFLQIHEGTVREMAKNGKLPARKVGREWRFSRTALIEWLNYTAVQEEKE